MRSIATLVATVGLLSFSRVSGEAQAKHQPLEISSSPVKITARPTPTAHKVEPLRTITPRGTVVVVPGECFDGTTEVDVVFHLHGNPNLVERAWRRTKVNSALLIMNHGETSTPYSTRYNYPLAFQQLQEAAKTYVHKLCPAAPKRLGRIALSAWSAGYASIQKLIRDEENAKRVDAVLLADGLHTGLLNKRPRQISEAGLVPFVDFAERATAGEKLFVMSHSSIPTDTFASTTETSDAVLDSLGLSRVLQLDEEHVGKLRLTSETHQKEFHLQGFSGTQARDHGDHLRGLDKLVFNHLSTRWARPREN
jgi:hypothetical protein